MESKNKELTFQFVNEINANSSDLLKKIIKIARPISENYSCSDN